MAEIQAALTGASYKFAPTTPAGAALVARARSVARMRPGRQQYQEALKVKQAAEALAPSKMAIAKKTAAKALVLQKGVATGKKKKIFEKIHSSRLKEMSVKLKLQAAKIEMNTLLRKKSHKELSKRLDTQSKLLKSIAQKKVGKAPSRMDDATSLGGEMSLLQIDAFPGPLQMGHEHCKIRAKVRALDMAMSQTPVAVCEECESKEYALHPTHIAGGIVYGRCRRLDQDPLWISASKVCNETSTLCHGNPMPLKCHEYVDGHDKNNSHIPELKTEYSQSLAFTCARVYTTDFAPAGARVRNVTDANLPTLEISGKIYRVVQASISSCHTASPGWTTSKQKKRDHRRYLSCVNKKLVKSCHFRRLEVEAPPRSRVTDALTLFEEAQKGAFEMFDEAKRDGGEGSWKDKGGHLWEACPASAAAVAP
jgi:hypothetical protein